MIPFRPFMVSMCLVLFFNSVIGAEMLDRIVASVNDDVILESDIRWEKAFLKSPLAGSGAKDVKMDRKSIIDRLVNRRLLLEKAYKFMSGKISEREVETEIQRLTEKAGGSDALGKILSQMSMDMNEFRRRVRNQMILESYIEQRIRMFIQIKDEEIDAYIRDHRAELGLIKSTSSSQNETEERSIRELVSVLLREKAVNQQLETMINELRNNAEIRFPDIDETEGLPTEFERVAPRVSQ